MDKKQGVAHANQLAEQLQITATVHHTLARSATIDVQLAHASFTVTDPQDGRQYLVTVEYLGQLNDD